MGNKEMLINSIQQLLVMAAGGAEIRVDQITLRWFPYGATVEKASDSVFDYNPTVLAKEVNAETGATIFVEAVIKQFLEETS